MPARPAGGSIPTWNDGMRVSGPGQSALLMADIAAFLEARGVRYAVIGAMAAAVHGVVRASLDADAVVSLQIREAQAVRQELVAHRDEIKDRHGNRVDLLLGLRGMDPELLNRTWQVQLGDATLEIVGREDFIAMKAFAGGPVDLADARAVIELDPRSLDLELLRRLAQRFGRDAARIVEDLLGAADE